MDRKEVADFVSGNGQYLINFFKKHGAPGVDAFSQLTDHLYISNWENGCDKDNLRRYKVKAILCLADHDKEMKKETLAMYKKMGIQFARPVTKTGLSNSNDCPIHEIFDFCYNFIQSNAEKNNVVLLQGQDGVSRTATIAIHFFLNRYYLTNCKKNDKWNTKLVDIKNSFAVKIAKFVQGKRSCIEPINQFVYKILLSEVQLKMYFKQVIEDGIKADSKKKPNKSQKTKISKKDDSEESDEKLDGSSEETKPVKKSQKQNNDDSDLTESMDTDELGKTSESEEEKPKESAKETSKKDKIEKEDKASESKDSKSNGKAKSSEKLSEKSKETSEKVKEVSKTETKKKGKSVKFDDINELEDAISEESSKEDAKEKSKKNAPSTAKNQSKKSKKKDDDSSESDILSDLSDNSEDILNTTEDSVDDSDEKDKKPEKSTKKAPKSSKSPKKKPASKKKTQSKK